MILKPISFGVINGRFCGLEKKSQAVSLVTGMRWIALRENEDIDILVLNITKTHPYCLNSMIFSHLLHHNSHDAFYLVNKFRQMINIMALFAVSFDLPDLLLE